MCDLNVEQVRRRSKAWLRNAKNLPPITSVVEEAIALLDSERAGPADVARVIRRDEAITAKILQVVNSAFYGLTRRIDTVSHAVALLGFEQVRLLVLGSALFGFGGIQSPTAGANREIVWLHSLSCARWAQAIAREVRYQPLEQAFIAGLLHDIGKTILAVSAPQEFASAINLSRSGDVSSRDAERSVIGVDHVEIGMLLSEHWKFPAALHQCIALHHDAWPPFQEGSELCAGELRQLLAIVRVANLGCRLFSAGQAIPEAAKPDALTPLPLEAVTVLTEHLNNLLAENTSHDTTGEDR